MGRQRLRPRLRRLPAPGGTSGRPPRSPPRVPHLARGLRRRLGAGRPRRRRIASHCHTVHQGRQCSVHRAGGSLDHHDELRGGPGAQQGDRDLHGDGRDRILARAGGRRPPDRDRLAMGVLPARSDRPRDASCRHPAGSLRRSRTTNRLLRSRRSGDADGRDVAARVHGRGGARGRLGLGAHPAVLRRNGRPHGHLRCDRASDGRASGAPGHPPVRDAGPGELRGDDARRQLVRLPVHGDAVHAAAAWLVTAGDRACNLSRWVPRRGAGAAYRAARDALWCQPPHHCRSRLGCPGLPVVPAHRNGLRATQSRSSRRFSSPASASLLPTGH